MWTALIFDVDGTLAETEEYHRQAFNQAFAERGLNWSWDRPLYADLLKVSGGKERMRAFAQQAGHTITDGVIAALHRRKTEIYTKMVAGGRVPLRPGIEPLIRQCLAAKRRLAVATTTSRANLDALFDGATSGHGHDWFETTVCAEDAPIKKPDPQAYRLVIERLGLDPASTLAVEDSANGVRSALAAGLSVIVTRSAFLSDDDVTGALAVFPDLDGTCLEDLDRLFPAIAPPAT